MKKKGFTLVELLAVIVILAIIAVIATPMILNVIDNVKKGAAESSAYGYVDAVEKSILEEELKGNIKDKNKVYDISELDFVNIKGDKPTEGWVKLEKGVVVAYSLKMGNYIVNNEDGEAVAEKGDTLEEKPDGSSSDGETGSTTSGPTKELATNGETYKAIVYLDPTDLTATCNASNSVSTPGTKEGCMKWYAYADDGTNYTMILDHNTTPIVLWNSTGSNSVMKDVADKLVEDTTTWIDSLKTNNVRLIEADEIAKITGNLTFNSISSTYLDWFFLDSNSQTQTATSQGASNYAWLYDYTNGCASRGCSIEDSSTYGYWTSTPVAGGTDRGWFVGRLGYLYNCSVDGGDGYGVRPVITISKTIIS